MAYELALPTKLAFVHLVFHVSMLKMCQGYPTLILPIEGLGVDEDFSYEEVPFEILDRQVKRLRNKEIDTVKVLWKNQLVQGATGEAEIDMRSRYPHLFQLMRLELLVLSLSSLSNHILLLLLGCA